MSSKTGWNVVWVAFILSALVLFASCGQQTEQETAALAQEVEALKQRMAQLEQRDTGTAVEAVKENLPALAAKVGQVSAPATAPPDFDEARVMAVAKLQAAITVEQSMRQLRAELGNKMRAIEDSIAAARDRQPQAGAGGRKPKQKMTPEQKFIQKAEKIAQKADLAAEQAQALGKIMLAYWQDGRQNRERVKAKEITKEEYRQAARDVRRKYGDAIQQYLADLNAQQREALEKALKLKRTGKRVKKGNEEGRGKRDRKKGALEEEVPIF